MTRTTLIVTDKNFRITIPEEIRTVEKIRQGDMIEIDVKNLGKHEDWECIKRILTKKDIRKNFLEVNCQRYNGAAIIGLQPIDRGSLLSIPPTEGYGIKLTLNDAQGTEIPDDAIIELWKERISGNGGQLLGEHEYREFKKEVKPLRDKISLSSGEELVIYVESKYAGLIYPEYLEFRLAVDFCVRR